MATVILINPFGTDCTHFLDGTFLVPQLLKGTVVGKGDTLYTLPYNNTSGIANIVAGVALLDAKIKAVIAAGGTVKVFAYSEGCQVADMWISENAANPPCGPEQLSFTCIGNANSKYGGFVYNHACFEPVGFTQGLPATVPWPYTMFARQYDGVADFPSDPVMQNALVSGQTMMSQLSLKTMSAVLQTWMPALVNTQHRKTAENTFWGAVLIHNMYLYVTPHDANCVSHQDPSGVNYVWSPTYPIPLLGVGVTMFSMDNSDRTMIEQSFDRPVNIPMPTRKS